MIALFLLVLILVFLLAKCILNILDDKKTVKELKTRYQGAGSLSTRVRSA